jgi:hypothetical protein
MGFDLDRFIAGLQNAIGEFVGEENSPETRQELIERMVEYLREFTRVEVAESNRDANALAIIRQMLDLPESENRADIVEAVGRLRQQAHELEMRADRTFAEHAAIEREVGNRYKQLIDVVGDCLATVRESGYVPAFGEPLTNQLRRAWRAVNRDGESAIVALAVDDRIENICKLVRVNCRTPGTDVSAKISSQRGGFQVTALPAATGEVEIAAFGNTVEAALDALEEKLCKTVGRHLDRLDTALKEVERSRHPLITLDPALEKIDVK